MDPHETDPDAVHLTDVAHHAGISLGTASRALSGSPGVSKTLSAHVHKVALTLGYTGGPVLTSQPSTAPLGLLLRNVADPYCGAIASAFITEAARAGRPVQVSQAAGPGDTVDQLRLLRSGQVGAIVCVGSGDIDPKVESAADVEFESIQLSGTRVVVIGRQNVVADAILPDDVEAGRTVIRHLAELGHRRIAIAAGPANLTSTLDRLTGIREESALHPIELQESHHRSNRAGGEDAARAALAGSFVPTAFVAFDEQLALGALSLFTREGIGVPERISIVCFGDSETTANSSPPLTVVRYPLAEIAREALRLALLGPFIRARKESSGHELVIRESTARAVSSI